jgi:hypothetical protein
MATIESRRAGRMSEMLTLALQPVNAPGRPAVAFSIRMVMVGAPEESGDGVSVNHRAERGDPESEESIHAIDAEAIAWKGPVRVVLSGCGVSGVDPCRRRRGLRPRVC